MQGTIQKNKERKQFNIYKKSVKTQFRHRADDSK